MPNRREILTACAACVSSSPRSRLRVRYFCPPLPPPRHRALRHRCARGWPLPMLRSSGGWPAATRAASRSSSIKRLRVGFLRRSMFWTRTRSRPSPFPAMGWFPGRRRRSFFSAPPTGPTPQTAAAWSIQHASKRRPRPREQRATRRRRCQSPYERARLPERSSSRRASLAASPGRAPRSTGATAGAPSPSSRPQASRASPFDPATPTVVQARTECASSCLRRSPTTVRGSSRPTDPGPFDRLGRVRNALGRYASHGVCARRTNPGTTRRWHDHPAARSPFGAMLRRWGSGSQVRSSLRVRVRPLAGRGARRSAMLEGAGRAGRAMVRRGVPRVSGRGGRERGWSATRGAR